MQAHLRFSLSRSLQCISLSMAFALSFTPVSAQVFVNVNSAVPYNPTGIFMRAGEPPTPTVPMTPTQPEQS